MRSAAELAALLLAATVCLGGEGAVTPEPDDSGPTRVLLIGASIGKAWDFPGLPERTGLGGYLCEYAGLYEFDKSPVLEEALRGDGKRPDVILVKECAAYFPGDLDRYRELVRGWVEACREAGVEIVPATVIPVAPKRTPVLKLKAWAKRLLSGRPGRNEQLREYNDWLRQYAREQGLEILDFEAALRVSRSERVLREDLDSGDGLHINSDAYRLLDRIAADLLLRVAPRGD